MKNNLTTPAGQTNPSTHDRKELINAINQVFALFRCNYHNQYYKAFPGDKELNTTMRLWLESLKRFSPECILKAAKSVIESSEFLPTLRTMIVHCESQNDYGLPDPHTAYLEACRAPSPKANQTWSHPAVYYAGLNTDWYFLQNNAEKTVFPIFKNEYEKLCQQVLQGLVLKAPARIALTEKAENTLDKKSNLKYLESLKGKLDL